MHLARPAFRRLTSVLFEDYAQRDSFTAQDVEHILQLPITEIVELIARVPRVAPGHYQGEACRAVIRRLARGRLFADLIARQAVNAEPVIRRGPESDQPDMFHLVNEGTGEEFSVRFSGDLANYLRQNRPPADPLPDPDASDSTPQPTAPSGSPDSPGPIAE